jgi:hypothetical protein
MLGVYDWFRRAELRWQIAREGAPSSSKRGSSDFQIWSRAVFPDLPADGAPGVFEQTWRVHTQSAQGVFERVRDEP